MLKIETRRLVKIPFKIILNNNKIYHTNVDMDLFYWRL